MDKPAIHSSLRVLILTLNLLNSRAGLTFAELLDVVPGYVPVDSDTARRKLERDIELLRQAGLDVQTTEEKQPRYRIATRSIPEIELTSEEFALLSRGADTWTESAAVQASVILNKLRAHGDGATLPSSETRLGLDGARYMAPLHTAIRREQPVTFKYQSRTDLMDREVAPWNLVARGRALYLWGFDLDRWAPRMYRLSRFRSIPQLIAEPGSVTPVGPLAMKQFPASDFVVAPLLCIAIDGAPLVRLRCIATTENERGDPEQQMATKTAPAGWEMLRGVEDDAAVWEAAVLRESDEVVVLEPAWLSDLVRRRLEAAAKWVKG